MFSVYIHTVPNGKVYVGMTSQNPVKRWGNGSGYAENRAFYADILKYGWNNIKHEILLTTDNELEARNAETATILKYDSTNPQKAYNKLIHAYGTSLHKVKKIMCINNEKIFDNAAEAARCVGLSKERIHQICRRKRGTAGKDPVTGEGLRWKYI